MAVYYSKDYENRIKEQYDRIDILMKEVFEQNSKCTGAWRLLRMSLLRTERGYIPYNDEFFNPYYSNRQCTTTEGMDLICLFFYRKDFAKEEFRSLCNAGIKTIQKFEEIYERLYKDGN